MDIFQDEIERLAIERIQKFSNMPKDGEVVEVLSYGKVEAMRFDKPYMAFNQPSITRLGGWALGLKRQEGITHFRRIDHNR